MIDELKKLFGEILLGLAFLWVLGSTTYYHQFDQKLMTIATNFKKERMVTNSGMITTASKNDIFVQQKDQYLRNACVLQFLEWNYGDQKLGMGPSTAQIYVNMKPLCFLFSR